MDPRTQAMLSAPPLPLLARLAAPNVVAFLVQAVVSMAEVWFVGRLGPEALAAMALVFPLLMLNQMMSGGALGGAVASSIARALGAGDRARAETLLWHALTLAGAFALAMALAFALFGELLLRTLGGEGTVLSQALGYGAILFPACIVLWLVNTLSAVLRGTGNMQLPARVMLLSAAVQVPLSGVLILGAFGVPAFGLAGAAVSVVSVAAVNSLFLLAWLLYRDQALRLRRDRFQLQRTAFQDIGRVALPALLSPLFTVLTIVSLTALVGRQGVDALAGYGIGSRIEFLLVPLVFGIGAALTAMVGTNIGAGQVARAEHIGWLGAGAAGVLTGVVGLLLALFPESWVGLFTDHPPTLAAGVAYMTHVGPAFGFLGVGLALYFASQGAGRVGWPVTATVLRFLVAVGGATVALDQFDLGLNGIYLAAASGMVIYGALTAASLALGAWRPKGSRGV